MTFSQRRWLAAFAHSVRSPLALVLSAAMSLGGATWPGLVGAETQQFTQAVDAPSMPAPTSASTSAPAVVEPSAPTPVFDDGLPYEELRRFAAVFAAIKNRYVEPVDNGQLIEAAIVGMMNDLDPHSTYLDQEAFEDLQEATEGAFGGLGIEISRTQDDRVEVISPIEDTPAAEAGVLPGDIIHAINGDLVAGQSLGEVVKHLRGDPGTEVSLTLARGEELVELTITRDIIQVRSVRSELLEHDIAYVRVAQFQERTVEELVRHLRNFERQPQALVLDLRNDPGGLLNAAVGVAGAFLPPETLVVYTKSRGEITLRYRVVPNDYSLSFGDPLRDLPSWSREVPMVVLINVGSASASEIVAGALQDYGRATIMGNRSFGKGSVQVVMGLGDDTGIKLTTARYYTPKERSIQATGIVPDIVVTDTEQGDFFVGRREVDLEDHLRAEDLADAEPAADETAKQPKGAAAEDDEAADLDKAAESADTKDEDTQKPTTMYRFGSPEDYQLRQAVNYLLGEYIDVTP